MTTVLTIIPPKVSNLTSERILAVLHSKLSRSSEWCLSRCGADKIRMPTVHMIDIEVNTGNNLGQLRPATVSGRCISKSLKYCFTLPLCNSCATLQLASITNKLCGPTLQTFHTVAANTTGHRVRQLFSIDLLMTVDRSRADVRRRRSTQPHRLDKMRLPLAIGRRALLSSLGKKCVDTSAEKNGSKPHGSQTG